MDRIAGELERNILADFAQILATHSFRHTFRFSVMDVVEFFVHWENPLPEEKNPYPIYGITFTIRLLQPGLKLDKRYIQGATIHGHTLYAAASKKKASSFFMCPSEREAVCDLRISGAIEHWDFRLYRTPIGIIAD